MMLILFRLKTSVTW